MGCRKKVVANLGYGEVGRRVLPDFQLFVKYFCKKIFFKFFLCFFNYITQNFILSNNKFIQKNH